MSMVIAKLINKWSKCMQKGNYLALQAFSIATLASTLWLTVLESHGWGKIAKYKMSMSLLASLILKIRLFTLDIITPGSRQ